MATRSLNPMGTRCTPESCWYTPVIQRAVTSVSCLKWISPAQRNAACLFGYCRFEVRLWRFCGFLEACHLRLCLLLFRGAFPLCPHHSCKDWGKCFHLGSSLTGWKGAFSPGALSLEQKLGLFPEIKMTVYVVIFFVVGKSWLCRFGFRAFTV